MAEPASIDLAQLAERLAPQGLRLRGAFHPAAEDAVPALAEGQPAGSLVLIGGEGGSFWTAFACSPEFRDGKASPLDRWSQRVISALADDCGARAFFPFDLPPLPFQRWAKRANPSLAPSPLGLLIHPRFGLWHSYRGALGFAERLDLPEPERAPSPCESCAERPCLTACPVAAFDGRAYDVEGCTAYLGGPEGGDCFSAACQARRACPVGPEYRYGPGQAQFHMSAFFAAWSEEKR